MKLQETQTTVTFITQKSNENVMHVALGPINEEGVDIDGNPLGKTMLESARDEYEKDLRNGFAVEHTGVFGPKGAIEELDWTADWGVTDEPTQYRNSDGVLGWKYIYKYAEWDKSGNKVRGTLERTIRHNGEVTVISSKKTFRKDW